MPLQLSGQISFSNIANEKGVFLSNVSLVTLSTTSINTDGCNFTNPNNGAPHGISEFYGYDHNCGTQLLYEHFLSGPYGSDFEACADSGISFKQFIIYSDCQSLESGCKIFYDPIGEQPFDGVDWYYSMQGVAWQIVDYTISFGAFCKFDGGGDKG